MKSLAKARFVALAASAVALFPRFAAAQPLSPAPVPPAPVVVVTETPRSGIAVSVGLGISHLSRESFQDITEIGAQAEARLIFGTRSPIAFEAAYIGTVREIGPGIGPEDVTLLMSNGGEAVLRINGGQNQIQPYVLGGVGWHLFQVVHHDHRYHGDITVIGDGDAVLLAPVGAGITGFIGRGFLIDARFAYRFAFGEDFFSRGISDGRRSALDSWSMAVQVGYEF